MNEPPIGRLDPERLKDERHDVDFGTDTETEHNHMNREPGKAPGEQGAVSEPTSGPIPPAQ